MNKKASGDAVASDTDDEPPPSFTREGEVGPSEQVLNSKDGDPPPSFAQKDEVGPSEQVLNSEDGDPPGVVTAQMVDSMTDQEHGLFQQEFQPQRSKSAVSIKPSRRSTAFLHNFFPDSMQSEWNDWRWQLRNRVTSLEVLRRFLRLSEDEDQAASGSKGLMPFAVTPYFLALLDPEDPLQPLRRTVVPSVGEFIRSDCESEDPLEEERDSPVQGLVHRYPDRVLLLCTGYCSVYCRYCTRSRVVGGHPQTLTAKGSAKVFNYIESHPEIRDVLLSGGDPLTLNDERLEFFLAGLRRIPHVEIIRIGTKVPVVLPQRITLSLVRMLKKYHPLFMSIHFTHIDELTPEVVDACNRLADAGIPLGSQTVLLYGVNDDVETLKALFQGLLRMRVKPYYLYQCDPIVGSSTFRTSVSKGLEIIEGLRGHTSGYAVPTYVIDAPGGGGKIPIYPNTVRGREGGDLLLRNYEGGCYRYPDMEQGKEGARSHLQWNAEKKFHAGRGQIRRVSS